MCQISISWVLRCDRLCPPPLFSSLFLPLSLFLGLSLPYSGLYSLFSLFFSPCLVSSRFLSRLPSQYVQPSSRYRANPLAVAVGVANLAKSSSPASTFAFVAFWPIGLAVRATSSWSIFSLVVRVNSSTSAALRLAVDIGGRTVASGLVIWISFFIQDSNCLVNVQM